MSETACAKLVRKVDPRLYATALMAREPVRGRLMVLYAFDVELSRAVRAGRDAAIPQIRLQWWHDVVGDAASGAAALRHDIAASVQHLIRSGDLDPDLLLAMASGYARELARPLSRMDLDRWAEERFSARLVQAARIAFGPRGMETGDVDPAEVRQMLVPLGRAMATAFAIEHAAAMAAEGLAPMLPELGRADRAALARAELTGALKSLLAEIAEAALRQIRDARRMPLLRRPECVPAMMPVARCERVLQRAGRPDFSLAPPARLDRPFDGIRMAWRALSGRW